MCPKHKYEDRHVSAGLLLGAHGPLRLQSKLFKVVIMV